MDQKTVLIIVLCLSVLFQSLAAVVAYRLIGVTGRRSGWLLISAALTFMAMRRVISLYCLVSGKWTFDYQLLNESIGLLLTLLMLGGIMRIGDIFVERKEAEKALKESEEKFRLLSETAADAITMIDNEGDIAYWNPAAERIFGYPAHEVKGKSLHHLLAPERYHDMYRKGFALYRETGDGPAIGKTLEFEAVKKDGTEIPVEVSFSVTLLNNERYAIGMIRDISERKRAECDRMKLEEQLRQAQKMEAIGQLSGGIAHDFNNILMAIIGFSNILKMKLDERDPLQADIDQILAASDRAVHLTQGMLAYSRKQIMAPKTIDLNDIVRNGENFLRRVIGEDVEFITNFSEGPLTIYADSIQIEQVLMNLVANARDAMPDGGSLFIRTDCVEIDDRFVALFQFAKKGEYALLSLSDTGVGMDETTARRIFEPFYTTKGVGHGTGLGLSVVYGIIKQHDGFITCNSELGKGTTFRIYLPIIHGEVEKGMLIPEISLPEGKETILLAEDDDASRRVSKRYLETFGYTVIEASDGEEAVTIFRENGDVIDLSLLDVIMPRLNGREVYKRIREIKPDAKVIFMSGYTADIIRKEEIVGEGLKVLTKPAMLKELLVTIREELGA